MAPYKEGVVNVLHNSTELYAALVKQFTNMENFVGNFTASALELFGSGWTWLVVTPERELVINNYANQDSPITAGDIPIIGIDVWEHAYYLDYRSERGEYVKNWWK
uniref:superoxide dismutase n=1 Tax=Lygus hesperus TaxID=30085 RepID=A0A0A9ZE22_LYGHE